MQGQHPGPKSMSEKGDNNLRVGVGGAMESSQCTDLLWNGSIFSITGNLRHPDILEGPMGPPRYPEGALPVHNRKDMWSVGKERHPKIHN